MWNKRKGFFKAVLQENTISDVLLQNFMLLASKHHLWPVFSLPLTCHCHHILHVAKNTFVQHICGIVTSWHISYVKRSPHQNILRDQATLKERRLELALRPRALPAASFSPTEHISDWRPAGKHIHSGLRLK